MFRGYGGGAGRGRRGGRESFHGSQWESAGGGDGRPGAAGRRSRGWPRAGFFPRRGRQGDDQRMLLGEFNGQGQSWRNRQVGWQEKKSTAPGYPGSTRKEAVDAEKGKLKVFLQETQILILLWKKLDEGRRVKSLIIWRVPNVLGAPKGVLWRLGVVLIYIV
ncbi:hypothetical protein C2845_PM13G11430 [Panicum miliaceum]|uniref:Uncharacterized protein n=1 Tax=Panicum miliaceum TaxID=4540 RepID=A0A3L6RKJ7_PANMI|nr:hypothetical protein C2845_PM13G11430 [Panicum miliaceum]